MRQVDRCEVESFLFHEAELLDEWRLDEWLALFRDDGTYVVPPTDLDPLLAATVDPGTTLCLIHDSMSVLRSRVRRLQDRRAHASNPRARTRHLVTNVRLEASKPESVTVRANFIVSSARHEGVDLFVGQYFHTLVYENRAFRIRERRAVLDIETLSPNGSINIIL